MNMITLARITPTLHNQKYGTIDISKSSHLGKPTTITCTHSDHCACSQVCFFGLAIMNSFKVPDITMDQIMISGWAQLLLFLVCTDVTRPWKCSTEQIELFFGMLKGLFRGNHREISVLDALVGQVMSRDF
jgi:hypothetical protein